MLFNRKGFTLIELLIVLIIIGVLATLAIPQYTGYVEKARAAEALSMISAIKTAEAAYKLDAGAYTTSLTSANLYIENIPTSDAGATAMGQYWYYTAPVAGTADYQIRALRSSKNRSAAQSSIYFYWNGATGAAWSGDHAGVPKQ